MIHFFGFQSQIYTISAIENTNEKLICTLEKDVLHQFKIPIWNLFALIWYPCPDLKSLKLPLFVIPLVPICNL